MKVWIIQRAGEDIIGVYASEELANKELDKLGVDREEWVDPNYYSAEEYDVYLD
jgi:hypothetical protein